MPGGGPGSTTSSQDTRFALRTLRRSPGFALTAVVTLALGIGVNIGMFSLVNGLLLRPVYERPDEVVAVYGRNTAPTGEYRGFSYPNYVDLREGTAGVFANLAAFSTVFVGLDVGEGARRTLASAVTANYFQIFGLPLALGRPFTVEEERPGADIRVAILSHPLWAATWRQPGHPRPARSSQRRAVHGRRRGAEGIHRGEHPRTRGVAAPGRERDAHHDGRVGCASAGRARGARVDRGRAAPSW